MSRLAQRLRIPDGTVEIDGSYGEGGGQIVRTACALSALTGIPCRIYHVRAGRKRPGLRPQHCTAIKGLASLCRAETSPLGVGAVEVSFVPRPLRPIDLDLDTGTAGSIGLVLQGLLLAGLGLGRTGSFTLRGGTDVPNAPTCDYIKNVKLPVLATMGYAVDMEILRRGYYPKGGGIVSIRLRPPEGSLRGGLHLLEAGEPRGSYGISHASTSLSARRVGERQKRQAAKALTSLLHAPCKITVEYGATRSPGSGLVLWLECSGSRFGASALGSPRKTAEEVAEQAVSGLLRTYHTRAALDPWLGDQILPYLALCDEGAAITVPYLSRHMVTNMWIVERFLNVRFAWQQEDGRVRIECRPESRL